MTVRLDHEAFVLDNGLEVMLHRDPRLPRVVVDLWYDVGSVDDPWGRSGFAHLFEHLMFKGTERVPEGMFDRKMEAVGGSNNASTGDDRTNYYDQGPSGALDLLLWLEADRMTGLDITQQKLDVEREVVRNERRQNYEDAPYGALFLELPRLLLPDEHPLSRCGIGTHEELLAAKLDDVRAFYREWYVPSNARLAVVGDFDPKATRRTIEATFGALPARPKPKRGDVAWPDRVHRREATLHDDVSLPGLWMAWPTAALYAPGDAELDVVASILTGADDARLVRRLVYEERSAQEVDVGQMSGRWGSMLVVNAFPAPGHTLEEIERAVGEELRAVATDRPPTDEELERARNNREIERLYSAESAMGRAELMQSWRMHLGRWDAFDEDVGRYAKVTRKSVVDVVSRLTPEAGATLRILPRDGTGDGSPDDEPQEGDA